MSQAAVRPDCDASLLAWGFEGAEGVPFDAVVIVVIVVANALLGYVQEARASRAGRGGAAAPGGAHGGGGA